MNKKQTELLFKDLCGRLPYGVKVELTHWRDRDKGIIDSKVFPFSLNINNANVLIKETTDIKPYLFPLSSMTEEQRDIIDSIASSSNTVLSDVVDFYNKNHFDYRGLIPMGLAIDVTSKNIY